MAFNPLGSSAPADPFFVGPCFPSGPLPGAVHQRYSYMYHPVSINLTISYYLVFTEIDCLVHYTSVDDIPVLVLYEYKNGKTHN